MQYAKTNQFKQGVALTGRNTTGPLCSVGHPIPTRPVAGADCPCSRRTAGHWSIRRASNNQWIMWPKITH